MHTKRSCAERQAGDGNDVTGRLTIWGGTLRSANVSMAAVASRLNDGVRDLSSATMHNRVIIPETSSNAILLRGKAQLKLRMNSEGHYVLRQPLYEVQPPSQ